MSLTSYRAAPSRAKARTHCDYSLNGVQIHRFESNLFLTRFGGDLLSHVLRRSTIGATGLIGRVRDGIESLPRTVTTKPRKEH